MNLNNNTKLNHLLSIVIPVYGTASTLPRCLESILNCTYKNIEIIVVNDASPDNASEIAKSYAEQDQRIHLVEHERNMGLYLARITGAKASQGEYLAFLDSDDHVSVDLYRRLIEKAQKSNSDMVIGEIYLQNENIYSYFNLSHVRLLDIDAKGEDASKLLFDQYGMDFTIHVVWNKIYRRDLWNNCIKYFEMQKSHIVMCEDVLYSSILFYFAQHITNIHGDFVYYVQNKESITSLIDGNVKKYNKNIDDICSVFDVLKHIFCEELHDCKYWKNILKWKELLLSIWCDNIDLAKLPIWEKRKLRLKLMDCLRKESLKRKCSKNFFYSVTTNLNCIPSELLKEKIVGKDIQIVSFDVFDTLVYRPFWNPTDLFYLLGQYVEDLLGVSDILDFSTLRIEAENKAREVGKCKNPAKEDITLDEIYSVLAEELDATPEQIEKIKQKEIQLEIQYCHPRKYAKELFELAVSTGKQVIITSDMYLTKDVVEKILDNCGYKRYEFLFLSSEVGLTKTSGRLFSYAAETMHVSPQKILHIGDNQQSDIQMAEKIGLKAFHFPKAIDRFTNCIPNLYGGELFSRIYQNPIAFRDGNQFDRFFGWKTLLAVVANYIFDNPLIPFHQDTDFNADPRIIGYFALGLHMFGVSTWLADAVAKKKYKNLNFMARDGYLPMECYKIVNQIYKNNAKLHYLYLTRSVMIPLQIQKQNDFYGLVKNITVTSQTPLSFVELIEPILAENGKSNILKICRENGYHPNKRFSSNASFYHFINLIRGIALDESKAEKYKEKIRAYLEPAFDGKSATFDVGYSCRVEATLKKFFEFCITPYYIHINNQLPYSRAHRMDLNFHTFYSYSPGVTGMLRELLMSKQSPSCLCLNVKNGKVVPVFKEYNPRYEEKFVVSLIQENAIQLVKDVVAIFGNDIVALTCQHEDISLAFEFFMSKPRKTDQKLFALGNFEDDLGVGDKVSTFDFWTRQIKSVANRSGNEIDLSLDWIHSKWERAICLYFLNRNYLKYKVKMRMRNHKIMLKFLENSYKACRKVYRTIHHYM